MSSWIGPMGWVRISMVLGVAWPMAGCTTDFTDHGVADSGVDASVGGDVHVFDDGGSDGTVTGDGAVQDGGLDGSNLCGNGIIDEGEQCDGTQFGGRTCQSETGLGDGDLACSADCRVDSSGCHQCGNGVIEGPEECEGSDFGGETCQSRSGMPDGSLACSSDCLIDDSGCYECGDGLITGPEECDSGGNVSIGGGCSANCTVESGYGCSGEPSVCSCTVYVNQAGPEPGNSEDGSDWAHAFTNLEEGVMAARDLAFSEECSGGVMVWIAQGSYVVTQALPMSTGLKLYGGFSGTETNLDDRSTDPSLTVISPSTNLLGEMVQVDGDMDVRLDTLTFDSGHGDESLSGSPGAILVDRNSDATAANCRFVNNDAKDGGAVYVEDSVLRLVSCEFTGNSSDNAGGAVFLSNDGRLRVLGSVFSGNLASRGGAISVEDGQILALRAGTTFEANQAWDQGGALYLRNLGFSPVVEDVIFRGNSAQRRGAAFFVTSSSWSHLTLLRTVLVDNTWAESGVPRYGGVVHLEGGGMDLVLRDVLIAGNHASSADSDNSLFGRDDIALTLVNTTVADNKADRLIEWTGVVFENSILWGNHWTDFSGHADCRYSLVGTQSFCETEEGVIHDNPLFVDSNNGDYHLQATSPCIDAADGDVADAADLDGTLRVDVPNVPDTGVGNPTYVDIGAYEYQP